MARRHACARIQRLPIVPAKRQAVDWYDLYPHRTRGYLAFFVDRPQVRIARRYAAATVGDKQGRFIVFLRYEAALCAFVAQFGQRIKPERIVGPDRPSVIKSLAQIGSFQRFSFAFDVALARAQVNPRRASVPLQAVPVALAIPQVVMSAGKSPLYNARLLPSVDVDRCFDAVCQLLCRGTLRSGGHRALEEESSAAQRAKDKHQP